MTRCLFVRPAISSDAMGGDEVVYRRITKYIASLMELEVLELAGISRPMQVLRAAQGNPLEVTRYLSRQNAEALRARLAASPFDVVCFAHEATFALSTAVEDPAIHRVFYAHNTHSLLAATDPSALGRLMRPIATAFERRWYGDPKAALVCISRGDVAGLRAAGVMRDDIYLSPPGAPPTEPLSDQARVIGEAVLTGSYGWWRKRRDLKTFAAGPPIDAPILATDPLAVEILGGQARLVRNEEVDWSLGLRFGLITDRFLGGFKLKSVEYVARNCMVLSCCDLSPDFEGLPHAGEFVRLVSGKAEVAAELRRLSEGPHEDLLARFRLFKAACLERYRWDACLQPLGAALTGRLAA